MARLIHPLVLLGMALMIKNAVFLFFNLIESGPASFLSFLRITCFLDAALCSLQMVKKPSLGSS